MSDGNFGFKTAHELFEHCVIFYRKGSIKRSIYVKCPRCGRIGRLRLSGKSIFGQKYKVMHYNYITGGCQFGVFSKEHDYLEEIYNKYKDLLVDPKEEELEREMAEFRSYLLNVEGYKPSTVTTIVDCVRGVLRRYGKFSSPEELKEFLRANTSLRPNTIADYARSYRAYLRFCEWREKKGAKRGVSNAQS